MYKLQETGGGSDESDDERYDSDGSLYRRRKRMSILSNRFINMDSEVGKGPPRGRRFFKSVARWDETYGRVRLGNEPVLGSSNGTRLAAMMEAAGRSTPSGDVTMDDWEDGTSV